MREWHVVVGNIVEEVNLILLKHQRGSNGMYRGVTPALVKEAASMVERREVIDVRFGSEPVQVANLKVRPLVILVSTPHDCHNMG